MIDDQKFQLFRLALMNALDSLEAIEELLDLKLGACTNPVHSLERVEQCDHCAVVEQNSRELLGLAIAEARAVLRPPVNPVVIVDEVFPTLVGNHVVQLSDVDTSADETVDVAPIDPAESDAELKLSRMRKELINISATLLYASSDETVDIAPIDPAEEL